MARSWAAASAVIAMTAMSAASCSSRDADFTYSGTVQADSAAVGSLSGGRIVAVAAADGQLVDAGQTIVRFDDRQARAAYDAAVARAAQTHAALADLQAGPRQADIDKARATALQAHAAYARARLNEPQQAAGAQEALSASQADVASARAAASTAASAYDRAQRLYAQGAISAQALDDARAAAQSAAGQLDAAQSRSRAAAAQLASVRSGAVAADVDAAAQAAAAADAALALVLAGSRPDQIAQARSADEAAAADVAAARARLDETRVVSPARGIVDGLDLHPGDIVQPGAAVATIDEFGDPWVRIYVPQPALGAVHIGGHARVRSDASTDIFDGRIDAIDAQAQFTPRDVQTSEDRADLTFGVKVRIHDPDHRVRAGTTVVVSLS